MPKRILSGRARPPSRSERARFRSLLTSLARSQFLEDMARLLVMLVIMLGMLLTTWGLIGEVSGFNSDLSTLVQFAGGGDAVLASTVSLFQTDILGFLGLANPDTSGGIDKPVANTGNPAASPTPGSEQDFPPIQVAVGGKQLQAPALPPTPTPFLPLVNTPAATAVKEQAAPPDTQVAASTPTADLTTTPEPPAPPDRIVIPKIGLDAPVIVSHTQMVDVAGQTFAQWQPPNLFAAGWQEGSAMLGEPGNTVINGHHNIDGEVFGHLYELAQGDRITVYSGNRAFNYAVAQVMKLEERNMPLAQREENARWVMPSTDERLTLVTCWPPYTNTYRLIVVAVPVK